jgi:hypothetical protein
MLIARLCVEFPVFLEAVHRPAPLLRRLAWPLVQAMMRTTRIAKILEQDHRSEATERAK